MRRMWFHWSRSHARHMTYPLARAQTLGIERHRNKRCNEASNQILTRATASNDVELTDPLLRRVAARYGRE